MSANNVRLQAIKDVEAYIPPAPVYLPAYADYFSARTCRPSFRTPSAA